LTALTSTLINSCAIFEIEKVYLFCLKRLHFQDAMHVVPITFPESSYREGFEYPRSKQLSNIMLHCPFKDLHRKQILTDVHPLIILIQGRVILTCMMRVRTMPTAKRDIWTIFVKQDTKTQKQHQMVHLVIPMVRG